LSAISLERFSPGIQLVVPQLCLDLQLRLHQAIQLPCQILALRHRVPHCLWLGRGIPLLLSSLLLLLLPALAHCKRGIKEREIVGRKKEGKKRDSETKEVETVAESRGITYGSAAAARTAVFKVDIKEKVHISLLDFTSSSETAAALMRRISSSSDVINPDRK
jgi:hypothetical protein